MLAPLSRRILVLVTILVFLGGWFSYTGYIYTNQILIVTIEGSITDFQATTYALHHAIIDPKVKAVILYFNTPGGIANSCLEIAAYVQALANVKPVVAVMGPQCGSGGYIIASFATYIFTHANTVTGGIGVFYVWVDLTEYYQKQGIKMWVFLSGEEKDFGAEWRSPTPEERAQIQSEVNELHQELLQLIQDQRNLSSDALEEVSTGTTFSGTQAVELGLADSLGDMLSGEEKARNLAGIWRYILVTPDLVNSKRFLKALL